MIIFAAFSPFIEKMRWRFEMRRRVFLEWALLRGGDRRLSLLWCFV